MRYLELFARSFSQVALITVNTWLIAREHIIMIIPIAFGISFLWASNVNRIIVSGRGEKMSYGLGGGVGSALAVWVMKSFWSG